MAAEFLRGHPGPMLHLINRSEGPANAKEGQFFVRCRHNVLVLGDICVCAPKSSHCPASSRTTCCERGASSGTSGTTAAVGGWPSGSDWDLEWLRRKRW